MSIICGVIVAVRRSKKTVQSIRDDDMRSFFLLIFNYFSLHGQRLSHPYATGPTLL